MISHNCDDYILGDLKIDEFERARGRYGSDFICLVCSVGDYFGTVTDDCALYDHKHPEEHEIAECYDCRELLAIRAEELHPEYALWWLDELDFDDMLL